MSIRNYLIEATAFVAAFWMTPKGQIIDCGSKAHIDFVVKHPSKFGTTEKYIQDTYDRYGEPVGFEGKAREEILRKVISNGFIRMRKYKNLWSVNVEEYNRRVGKMLSNWAYEMISNKIETDKYIPVNITCNKGIPPKNIDMEGLSGLSESHDPLVVITLNEMVEFVPKKWYDEVEKIKPIEESSLARVWQHIEDEGRSFGVISAFVSTNSEVDNRKKHAELRSKLRKYGYIELKGGYKYEDDDEYSLEKSYLVPNITKKDLLQLCKDFNQESVIYKDSKEFALIKQDGSVEMNFMKAGGKANLQQSQEAVKYFFSSLLKGAHGGRKFAFKLLESKGIQNHIHAMGLSYENPVLWYTIIEN